MLTASTTFRDGPSVARTALTECRPLLEVRDLSKQYGVVWALKHVNMAVQSGEIVALAGENGSGKSTLAKILAGSLAAESGEVLLDGTPVSFRRPRDALDHGIAVVTQEISAVPKLSIAENVLLASMPGPLNLYRRQRFGREAALLLERVGVSADPQAPFSTLGVGDRERVEIARALATRPRLMILDEATSRLGEEDVSRLFRLLDELRAQGTSVIIITHRMREIGAIADRAIVLRDGVCVGELDRESLSERRLATMMVGREVSEVFPVRSKSAPAPPILRVEGLVVAGATAPLSFSLRPGQIIGLTGLVGSGRTELLETLAGLRRYQQGRICMHGRVLRPGSIREAIWAGISLLPEDRHRQGLVMGGSVQSNIAMGTWRVFGAARNRRDQAVAAAAVKSLGIKTYSLNAPVTSLSGGNQQRVVLGRCLTARPSVLLLDEPARGIDVAAKAEMYRFISEIVAGGMAVVMASSEMMEILGMADDIIVLHEGRMVAELPRAQATEQLLALLAGGGHDVEHVVERDDVQFAPA